MLDDCSPAAIADRDALKLWFNDPLETNNNTQDYYRLWNIGKGCEHGSALDQMAMTYTSFTGYLRYAGGFSASLSSAIASLVGAPRVLQVTKILCFFSRNTKFLEYEYFMFFLE